MTKLFFAFIFSLGFSLMAQASFDKNCEVQFNNGSGKSIKLMVADDGFIGDVYGGGGAVYVALNSVVKIKQSDVKITMDKVEFKSIEAPVDVLIDLSKINSGSDDFKMATFDIVSIEPLYPNGPNYFHARIKYVGTTQYGDENQEGYVEVSPSCLK